MRGRDCSGGPSERKGGKKKKASNFCAKEAEAKFPRRGLEIRGTATCTYLKNVLFSGGERPSSGGEKGGYRTREKKMV